MPGSTVLPEKPGKKAERPAQARPQSPAEAGPRGMEGQDRVPCSRGEALRGRAGSPRRLPGGGGSGRPGGGYRTLEASDAIRGWS